MPSSKLKIVSLASEVAPFTKTGGLGDVTGSLPKALKKLGHNVTAITPFYKKVIDTKKYSLKKILEDKITIDKTELRIDVWQGEITKGLPIYFIGNDKFFSRRKDLYGSDHENQRFYLFNIASLWLLEKLNLRPDIIQCHDWFIGLVPYLIKNNFKENDFFASTATIFTIHNLSFQFGRNWWEVPLEKKDFGRNGLPNFSSPLLEYINFAKRGIMNTDIVNTVSEQYADEIITKKFGEDLQRILANRQDKLFGIINGIDYFQYNPKTDPGLYRNYDASTLARKKDNKLKFQKDHNLAVDENIPIISMTSRLSEQKGFDMIMAMVDPLMRLNIQLVILGEGEKKYEKLISKGKNESMS